MKKLLISAITALAFLFGFASCSGDLHDVGQTDISKLYVKGTLPGLTWGDDVQIGGDTETAKTPFVKQADGSYVWEFVAVSNSANFAFDIGGWNETYRGTDKDELFKGFDTDFNKEAVEGILYPHNDRDCMPVTMESGASYKMTVTGGAGTVICKIEKTKDAINMTLVTPDESIALTPINATDVQYEFTPETDGELKFYIVNGVINIAPDSDKELEFGTPFTPKMDFTSTEPGGWYKFQYKANIPHKVVVSYTEEEGITITVGYSFVAAGLGCTGWGRSSFEIKTEEDEYKWTESFDVVAIEYDKIEDGYAYYKAVEFPITKDTTIGADIALRNDDSWTVRYELGDGKELTQDEWYKLEKGLDPKNKRAYIKFAEQEGKVADKITVSYRENLSDNSVEVSYIVVYKDAAAPTYYNLEGKYISGNYLNSEWGVQEGGAPAFTAVSNKEHTFSAEIKVGNTAGWTEFGAITSATDTTKWESGLGFSITELDKAVEGSTSGGNSKIADGVAKYTGVYTLTIEVVDTNGNLKATLTQKTAPQEIELADVSEISVKTLAQPNPRIQLTNSNSKSFTEKSIVKLSKKENGDYEGSVEIKIVEAEELADWWYNGQEGGKIDGDNGIPLSCCVYFCAGEETTENKKQFGANKAVIMADGKEEAEVTEKDNLFVKGVSTSDNKLKAGTYIVKAVFTASDSKTKISINYTE